MELKIWNEVQELLLPLSQAQRRALANSIALEGVKMPVLHLPDGRIIDGHHRWELSEGKAPTQCVDLPEDRAFGLAIALNVARRQMTPEQIVNLQERLRQDKQKQRETALQLREQGMTQQAVAATVGVSDSTVSNWESEFESNSISGNVFKAPDLRMSVPKSAHSDIANRRANGERAEQIAADLGITPQRVSQIAQQVHARTHQPPPVTETIPLPEKRYKCIVIDPPWPMEKIEREERPNQGKTLDYPVMSLEAIGQLPIQDLIDPAGCHLYLWTTHKFLPAAFDILHGWGARYVLTMVWHKAGGIQPFGLPQYNCEFVLLGRTGSPSYIETKAFPCCFTGERRAHSQKPVEFFETIARVDHGPRLEMFAREVRNGFESWGNECKGNECEPQGSQHVSDAALIEQA